MRVFLTRMALVPRFFALQLLYPRAQRALRKLLRVVSGDRKRRTMSALFFNVWLNDSAHGEHCDLRLLDR